MAYGIQEQLLANVVFDAEAEIGREQLKWDQHVGFLVDANAPEGHIGLVGFAAPYLPRSRMRDPEGPPEPEIDRAFRSLTEFGQVPRPLQSLKHSGKGVGLRMYPDWETAHIGGDTDESPSLFHVAIPKAQWLDVRPDQGSERRQIIRHALRRAAGVAVGAQAVAGQVHRHYDEMAAKRTNGSADKAAAVRMSIPPSGRRELERAGSFAPIGVEPGFVILRSPLIVQRLGTVTLQ